MCMPGNLSFSLAHQSLNTSHYLSLCTWPLIKIIKYRLHVQCSVRWDNHPRTVPWTDNFCSSCNFPLCCWERIYLAAILQENYMEKSNNISNCYHIETIKIVTNRCKQTYISSCILQVWRRWNLSGRRFSLAKRSQILWLWRLQWRCKIWLVSLI